MSLRVAVLVPVLDRPQRVGPLVESLSATTAVVDVDALFVVSPGDGAEHTAVKRAGLTPHSVPWEPGPGDYQRKINWAFKRFRGEYTFLLLGADDLQFHPGWVERALAVWQETGACVIGTNDGGNRRVITGSHSTHPLVHRDYLDCGTADEHGKIYHEGYYHNFCDDEFIGTATARGTYAPARDCRVEHLHPDWGKAEMDATYRLGKAHFSDDAALFRARKRLWVP